MLWLAEVELLLFTALLCLMTVQSNFEMIVCIIIYKPATIAVGYIRHILTHSKQENGII